MWTWKTGVPPTGSVRYGKQYRYSCPRCRGEVVPTATPSIHAIDLTNLGTSLALGPVVLAGVFTGVRLASRVKPTLFYRLVMAGMVLSGGKLLWDALN